MNIGNLLNDQSPKTKSASLPDPQQNMNESQPDQDANADRRPMPPHNRYPGITITGDPLADFNNMIASYPGYRPRVPTNTEPRKGPTQADIFLGYYSRHEEPEKPPKPKMSDLPKNFACSTCGKTFARRSDLVRHERIHSGIRPHKCPWPYCDKQFIQRSALTVHQRVHSGEKPHMCEKCSKQFSDSSSLARHRRIHSGKRPYKCPYPDCQKTFTRRTTLTRHQSNHTGSLEEAEANRAAALASHASAQIPEGESSRGEGDAEQSDASSSVRSQPPPPPPPAQQSHSSAPHLQQPGNPSRASTYGQGMVQNFYPPSALPSSATGQGTTPSSRAPPSAESHHPYRPSAAAYPSTSAAHSASHSPSSGLMQSHENYHSYQQDPRFQQGYSGSYYPTHRQQPAGNDPQLYDQQHGQINPAWNASSSQSM